MLYVHFGLTTNPISVVVKMDAAGWMLLKKAVTVKALQALKRRREVVSLVLDFFRKRDKAAPADLKLKVVCN